VALHACDTATDEALAYAIQHSVPVVFAAPCCQHELNAVLDAKKAPPVLEPILAHGLFRERFAALATDAIRAAALTEAGYRVAVLEFVDSDCTPKNTLIRAVLPPGATAKCADSAAVNPLAAGLGVNLTLERLLHSEFSKKS
jgi:hypothetical protein